MKKLLIIILVFSSSCLEVDSTSEANFVVEAYVYTGEPVRNIRVKQLVSLDTPDGDSELIDNADVSLMKSGTSFHLTYNNQTGYYTYSNNDLVIAALDEIHLDVTVNNRHAQALTVVPTSPVGLSLSKEEMVIPEIKSAADFIGNNPLEDAEILLDWQNPAHELHYVVIEFRSNLLRPILPSDIQEVVDGLLEDFAIITPPDTISSYLISGALLPSYGPYVAKVYKVNQEYADLFDSEEQDSRDLNDPPSNIINARGIFTAFSSDSLSFEIVKP